MLQPFVYKEIITFCFTFLSWFEDLRKNCTRILVPIKYDGPVLQIKYDRPVLVKIATHELFVQKCFIIFATI